tara:strand:- start:401 stop:592 length:192 start_codon:yes stop_codon:yes gene_type:complete
MALNKHIKIFTHKGKKFLLQKSRTTGRFAFRETLLSDHDLVSMPDNKTIEINKTGMPYLKTIK